jgi:acyl carrier protein
MSTTLSMNTTRQTLRAFVLENYLYGADAETLQDDESFLDGGIIDSTGVMELIAHIEGTFGITVEDHEMVPENLDSIDGLCRYLETKDAHIS